MILNQPYISSESQSNSSREQEEVSKTVLMAGSPDAIFKEMEVKDLGHFTAYNNQAIKAVFQDRTIVRIMKDCRIIRILNHRGDELLFNLDHPHQGMTAYNDYIKVSQEFFEHSFLSDDQKTQKQTRLDTEKTAIEYEMERIQRTVMLINEEKPRIAITQNVQQQVPVNHPSYQVDTPESNASREIEQNNN